MPELPDITVYCEALAARTKGQTLERARVLSPFLLRSVEPALDVVEGHPVLEIRRLGKRVAMGFDGGHWLVFHLMIAGRFDWLDARPSKPSRQVAALFEFSSGTLLLREAGKKKRASLHVVRDADLAQHDPGGLEVLTAGRAEFDAALRRGNHTLKRALTDPRILSGIGNAYSDEILHRARLSPVMLTSKLDDAQSRRLYEAAQSVLTSWTETLRSESRDRFPAKVTAFREGMAVHGRFGQACPDCGTRVQRIRYASNETNYCPRCQTEGRLLADRSLSRLLKKDWPRTIDELEGRRGG